MLVDIDHSMLREMHDFPAAEPMPAEIAALRGGAQPVWIFAYGSLMWDPEFPRAEAEPGLLRGYHRSFCLYSYDYRGTRARPGLTLGLDRGGSCRGLAFRLQPESLPEAIDLLWWREMTAPRVYDMRLLPIRTHGGTRRSFAFTVRRDHPDYAGRLPLDAAAHVIATAEGRRGTCRDYLLGTLRHLEELGLADKPLRRLAQRVEALAWAPIGDKLETGDPADSREGDP
jgi:glutathione-specific gamma-glutamylcyclotransferase